MKDRQYSVPEALLLACWLACLHGDGPFRFRLQHPRVPRARSFSKKVSFKSPYIVDIYILHHLQIDPSAVKLWGSFIYPRARTTCKAKVTITSFSYGMLWGNTISSQPCSHAASQVNAIQPCIWCTDLSSTIDVMQLESHMQREKDRQNIQA